ncbi:PAS domain S-box protein [Guyparkeria sp. 1SP6A2]|nr:PAS domain S-box protein [Guyparkeria sp. 1SP6A2]
MDFVRPGIALFLSILPWFIASSHARAESSGASLAESTALFISVEGLVWLASLVAAVGAGYWLGHRRSSSSDQPEVERLQLCFERNTSMLVLTNAQTGNIINANQSAADFYGWSREDLIGRPLRELWVSPCPHWERSTLVKLSAPACHLHTHRLRSGETRVVEVHVTPFRDVDGATYVFSILHDVTERERAAETLQRERRRLGNVIASTHAGTWEWRIKSGAMACNERLAQILGYRPDELDLCSVDSWQELVHIEDRERVAQMLSACRHGGRETFEIEARMYRADGEVIWTLAQGRILEWTTEGAPLTMWGTLHDITTRKRMEQDLWLAASVFSQANEAIMITGLDARITDVNGAFTRMTGWTREEVVGHTPKLFQSGLHDRHFYRKMRLELERTGHWSGEVWNCNKSGELYAERLAISLVRDAQGRPCNYIALATDITDLKNYQKELEHRAFHDELTALPNRALLADRLRQDMAAVRRNRKKLAVVFLDLDGFKAVNDHHGHEVGDRLLRLMSGDFKELLRASDTLARVSGDEFVALLPDLDRQSDVRPVLDRLLQTAARTRVIDGRDITISASVGVTFFTGAFEVDGETLLRQADSAMYHAKRGGQGRLHIFEAPDPAEDAG